MNVRGWLYLITNEAMPGLVKIGFSLKDPALRAAELSTTGTPLPFRVCYDALVFSPRELEQRIHADMKDLRAGKEWFRCEVSDAVKEIRATAKDVLLHETCHVPLRTENEALIGSEPDKSAKLPEAPKRATSCPSCRMTNVQPDNRNISCLYCGTTYYVTPRLLAT